MNYRSGMIFKCTKPFLNYIKLIRPQPDSPGWWDAVLWDSKHSWQRMVAFDPAYMQIIGYDEITRLEALIVFGEVYAP